jgi:hypothetical protein
MICWSVPVMSLSYDELSKLTVPYKELFTVCLYVLYRDSACALTLMTSEPPQ